MATDAMVYTTAQKKFLKRAAEIAPTVTAWGLVAANNIVMTAPPKADPPSR